jgi:hypothetical protein
MGLRDDLSTSPVYCIHVAQCNLPSGSCLVPVWLAYGIINSRVAASHILGRLVVWLRGLARLCCQRVGKLGHG